MDRGFLGICSCAAGICGACGASSAYCLPDLGYVAPVLFLLLIGSLILAKQSWKSMICHLFFTLSAGFFLIFLTQFFSVHSARNIYISLYQTFSYLFATPLAENWSGGEGLMLTVLLAPAAVGLYALATTLKKRQQ